VITLAAIANRYAKALVDVSFPQGLYEQVGQELDQFDQLLTENRELHRFYANPAIPAAKKKLATSEILQKLAFCSSTANFILILIDNYRMGFFSEIRTAYYQFLNERMGVVRVDVTSALAIDPQTQAGLTARLEKLTSRKVQLKFASDASLVGGLVTRIGDTIYDGSVRQQLNSLKNRLSV
jgi:F-type H+-transporting ATPase subunit delta